MRKFIRKFLVLTVIASISSLSYGQFGGLGGALRSLQEKVNPKEESVTDADEADTEELVNAAGETGLGLAAAAAALSQDTSTSDMLASFVSSYVNLIDAQISLNRALGTAEDVQELLAQKEALQSGKTDRDTLVTIRTLSSNVNIRIGGIMQKTDNLNADAGATVSEAIVSYFKALADARTLALAAGNTGMSVATGGLTGLASQVGTAGVNLYIVKELPGYVIELVKTGRLLLEFANRNNIKTPDNATALLADL